MAWALLRAEREEVSGRITAMTFGVHNKVLRINLTTGTHSVEEPGESFFRRYMGGLSIIACYLLKETPAHTDPLSPQNPLIFACGILSGIPVGGAGRNSIGARSPLTGAIASSEVGGFWAAQFRKAGYDVLIVEGRSDSPVYLWIQDGEVEIRDASHLWGLDNLPAHTAIREELGVRRASIAQIGPAGENQVLYANIMADMAHSAGRGGLGAVMGSKNLKAVAVNGSGTIPVSDEAHVKEEARWLAQNRGLAGKLAVWGTGGSIRGYNAMKVLPVHNFHDGWLEDAENVHPEHIMEEVGVKMGACYACPVRCKKVVRMEEPYSVDPAYGGPEYETIGAIGTNCGITDVGVVSKASERMNALGMDTMSCGTTIAWAMEAFERGMLTADMNGGRELRFGDGTALLEMIEAIALRVGLGDLLAQGVKRASEHIRQGSEEFAMHVKGQEIPLHDPRVQHGIGLGYALSYTGADHNHNVFDLDYSDLADAPDVHAMGVLEPIDAATLSVEKVRAYAYGVLRPNLNNIIGFCNFIPFRDERLLALVRAVTGWNCSQWELMKAAERGITMARAYNAREGFTAADDTLPERFFTAIPAEGTVSKPIDAQQFRNGVELYYQMMGWDASTGRPSSGRLAELDIAWVEEVLDV